VPGEDSEPIPIVPDHEVARRIGKGAYGQVWLARNALGAWRAVKVVYRQDFEELRPFEREFSGIQKFEPISRSNEGLVQILQVGRREDYFYYVMELADPAPAADAEHLPPPLTSASEFELRSPDSYVPRTLREDLRQQGRLPAERCVEIGLALASGLAHLHEHGLVHRDIKPSNIILVRGRPKLADIGLVTDVGDSRSIVGTEGYLPPEGPGTPQGDIFSLGKVLFEISTGQDRRRFPDLPPELKAWSDGDAVLELNQVVVKACQDPSRRYPQAEAMVADLELLRCGGSVRSKRVMAHRLTLAKWVALAVFGCGLLVALLFWVRDAATPYPLSSISEVNKLVDEGYHFARRRTPENRRYALKCFDDALKLDPHFLSAYFGLYYTRVVANRDPDETPAESGKALEQVATNLLRLFPRSAEAQSTHGLTLWSEARFEEARAVAYRASKARAGSRIGEACAHSYYGWILLQSGKPDQALAEFQIAEKLHPESAVVYQLLGHPYKVKRQFKEALAEYRESLKYEDRQGQAHYLIGDVYLEQTNFIAALQEYAAGDEAQGSFNDQRKKYYDALREAIVNDPVQGYWRQQLSLAEHDPHSDAYTLASLYARLGKDRAYDFLESALKQRPFNAEVMFDLAWNLADPRFISLVKRYGLVESNWQPYRDGASQGKASP
jgi:serine/threonine protein kinase